MPDYAIVGDERTGNITIHKADCPDVGKASEAGRPVITMLDCKVPLPAHAPGERHSCLPTPSRWRERA